MTDFSVPMPRYSSLKRSTKPIRPRKKEEGVRYDAIGRRCKPRIKGKTVPCPICGKEFISYGLQKTCSMKCKLEKGIKKRRRKCKACGIEFITDRPAHTNKYCSKKCSEIGLCKPLYEFDCVGCGTHVAMRFAEGIMRKKQE